MDAIRCPSRCQEMARKLPGSCQEIAKTWRAAPAKGQITVHPGSGTQPPVPNQGPGPGKRPRSDGMPQADRPTADIKSAARVAAEAGFRGSPGGYESFESCAGHRAPIPDFRSVCPAGHECRPRRLQPDSRGDRQARRPAVEDHSSRVRASARGRTSPPQAVFLDAALAPVTALLERAARARAFRLVDASLEDEWMRLSREVDVCRAQLRAPLR